MHNASAKASALANGINGDEQVEYIPIVVRRPQDRLTHVSHILHILHKRGVKIFGGGQGQSMEQPRLHKALIQYPIDS